jgi:hypothetical protein
MWWLIKTILGSQWAIDGSVRNTVYLTHLTLYEWAILRQRKIGLLPAPMLFLSVLPFLHYGKIEITLVLYLIRK